MSLFGQILNVNQPWWFAVKSNTTGITEPCIRFRIKINHANLTYFIWHTYNCVVFFLYCAVWTEGRLEYKSDCVPMFFWLLALPLFSEKVTDGVSWGGCQNPTLRGIVSPFVYQWQSLVLVVRISGLRSSDLLTTDFIAVLGDKAGQVLSSGRNLTLMD